MKDEPVGLTAGLVGEWLRKRWGIRPAELSYAPVGYASYHWIAADEGGPRWFVTADDLTRDVDHLPDTVEERFATLSAAADTVRQLADEGHEYVLAPIAGSDGTVVQRMSPGWALQVTPYVHGWSTDQGAWDDPAEQAEVARLVGRLHAATPPSSVPRWDFAVPGREVLEASLDDLGRPWEGGPYAEAARAFLIESLESIRGLLRRYDDLTLQLEADPDPWVVTHGEPDSDNVVRGDDGRTYLIDWGSVKLAPRERDLVEILNGVADVQPDYLTGAGRHATPARAAGLELFGIGWSLTEIRRKAQLFRGPVGDHVPTVSDLERLREQATNPGGWFRPASTRMS
ncbi:phosphotransferase [Flindersiella endophytica]